MTSKMRETMWGQPAALRSLSQDLGRVHELAATLRAARRVLVVGTGTSWHAANQGARFLQLAGLEAWALASADFATDTPKLEAGDMVIAMTHTGAKRYTAEALVRAKERGAGTIMISAVGTAGADLETVPRETSAAYTASHLAALYRMAQLAASIGAKLGNLEAVPDAIATVMDRAGPNVEDPERLMEFVGGGINQWTATEAALKTRETAYVATEGLGLEQFLHGPSVALRETDTLVCFDGGGPWTKRLTEVARAAESSGVTVEMISEPNLGEPLSIFPLVTIGQRIALHLAEVRGTNPDSFGRDVPGREAWSDIKL